MSCFVLDPHVHAAIADTLAAMLNSCICSYKDGYFGRLSIPKSLWEALEACRDSHGYREYSPRKIFAALYSENVRAYNGRYRVEGEDIEVPDMPEVPQIYHPAEYANHHQTVQPWHTRFLKLVDCLHYQLDEDATAGSPINTALGDLSTSLCRFIARCSDAYEEAPWGDL